MIEAITILCSICGERKPPSEFGAKSKRCKPCRSESDKERAKDPRVRTARGIAARRRSSANPEAFRAKKRNSLSLKTYYKEYRKRKIWTILIQDKARREVAKAIKNGTLTRPEACSSCGKIPIPSASGRKLIQAHHHKGYEYPLDVQWLCSPCHKEAHGCVKYKLP